jgi:hypothetical protein
MSDQRSSRSEGSTEQDWPDIPDTPEQRALIEKHNADIRKKHPNLVEIEDGVIAP